jgi:hypothetical protein
MEPELQRAFYNQTNDGMMLPKEFFNQLKTGITRHDLEKQLGLSTHNPGHMNADDVSKLAAFTYNHPDIFRNVWQDQPAMIKEFLSATRWSGQRWADRFTNGSAIAGRPSSGETCLFSW